MNEHEEYGGYELIEKISQGSFTELFLAKMNSPFGFSKTVALKRLRKAFREDSLVVNDFLKVASNAADINSPGVPSILSLDEAEGTYFFTMVYIDGESLQNTVKRTGPFSIPSAVFVVLKVLEVLEAMQCIEIEKYGHKVAFAHGFLHPSQILISNRGKVFTLVSSIDLDTHRRRESEIDINADMGYYQSPEQVKGLSYDTLSNQFSIASILHELLLGSRPFQDGKWPNEISNIWPGLRGHLDEFNTLPEALRCIIDRALAVEGKDRYSSTQEMRLDLEGYLNSLAPGFDESDLSAAVNGK